MLNVAIIGAGAAGCFCAVNLKRMLGNNCSIDVFEAGRKPLAKVAITGGGRCNLTNSFQQVSSLALAYPRGERLMKRLFFSFSNDDAMRWWQNNGVELVVQNDCCVFPRSQDAMQIVSTLTSAMTQSGVRTHLQHRVSSLQRLIDGKYRLSFSNDANSAVADVVLVAVGGCPSANMLSFLEPLALNIKPVVPSLFTFNIKDSALTQLMGVVVKDACVSIPSTKFKADGPLLVTHWGLSGPAILKLSSYSAVFLAEKDYKAPLLVSWLGRKTQPEVEALLSDFVNDSALIAKYAADDSFGDSVLGGQNPLGIFSEGVATVDLSNVTAYDQGMTEEFQTAMKDYFEGKYATYEDAVNAFYDAVLVKYPSLSKPN